MQSSRSRRAIAAAATLALSPIALTASAQSTLPAQRLRPITSPVRDAGILHLASGTWTRKVSAASLGSDVIYDNTCWSNYFSSLSGDTFVDEGRVPSPTSPTSLTSRAGCATSYGVDGFQISYCTDQPGPLSFQVAFFESHAYCTTTVGVMPTATFSLAGLPGSPVAPTNLCWTVTTDLTGSSSGFTMLADGDGSYAGAVYTNLFAWSILSTLPPSLATRTGPVLAGFGGCSSFDGTVWDSVYDPTEAGNGMGTQSAFYVEGGPTTPGCYWFGSAAISFHLELYAEACPGQPDMTTYCSGDPTEQPVPACPCANNSTYGGGSGCRNSLGLGGRLRGSGTPSLAADTLVLNADQMPATTTALFFQGTQRTPSDLHFGDGLRCAGGSVLRLATYTAVQGAATCPRLGDPSVSTVGSVTSPGVRTYQVWYRNSAAFCTPAAFNLTNGLEVTWDA